MKFLFFFALAVVTFFSVLVSAAQPKSPFEPFCFHRLNEIDWRAVLYYQQSLIQTGRGRELITLLRNAGDGEDSVKVQDAETVQKIKDLIHSEILEKERQMLFQRSSLAFHCVDEFERRAAGNVDKREWQSDPEYPVDPDEEPNSPHPDDHHNPDKFKVWDEATEEFMHPETRFH